MLYYKSKAVTDIGNKREVNQDSYIALEDLGVNKYIGIYCVADGMGGLDYGEYASKLAVGKSIEWYKTNLNALKKKNINERKLKRSLKELFYNINMEIYNFGLKKDIRIGTTYSLLFLAGDKYYVVHAGDSRIYLKREEKLYLLTKDQTWVNEQVDNGLLSYEQALNHPQKNVLANCIGCFEEPSICMGDGEVMSGDSFMLCSDGLYNLVTIDEIFDGMSREDLDFTSSELVDLVKSRGAYDNITILLIRAF